MTNNPEQKSETFYSASIVTGYFLLTLVVEIIINFVRPEFAVILYSIMLILMSLYASLIWERQVHRLIIALLFVPLMRLALFTLPLEDLEPAYWYSAVSVPLLVGAIIALRPLNLSGADAGLRANQFLVQITTIAMGVFYGVIGYDLLDPAPIADTEDVLLVIAAAGSVFLAGIAEEIVFRGIVQQIAVDILGVYGIIYTACLLTVFYLGYGSFLFVTFVLLVNFIYGWVRYRTGSVLGVAVSHGALNVFLLVITPLYFT